MENDENLVSIKTEKVNQLKGIYFPKVREFVELISCQTSDAIPVMCMPKGH